MQNEVDECIHSLQPWIKSPYSLISWWDMEQFSADGFFSIASQLSALIEGSEQDKNSGVRTAITSEEKPIFLKALRTIEADCSKLGLKVSTKAAAYVLRILDNPKTIFSDVSPAVGQLRNSIQWEMETRCFFSLTAAEAECFSEWFKGWEKIIDRFGDCTRDVEEMQKCFALGRYTAAMFHALHVAEWGAIYLGDHIGVTDPKKSWGASDRKLRDLVKGGHGAFPSSLGCSFEFVEQMHREVQSMMLAWRHKVDHAVNHLAIVPNTDFTPDVAEHIIGSVRVFMQRLIEGIPAPVYA